MSKHRYALQQDWGKEHHSRPWSSVQSTIDDAQHCPLCGAERIDGDADAGHEREGSRLLRTMALLNVDKPLVLQMLLRRVVDMMSTNEQTLEQIATRVIEARQAHETITRQAIYHQCLEACKEYPELARYLTPVRHTNKKETA